MTRPLFPVDPQLFATDFANLPMILGPHERSDKEYTESGPFREVRTAWIDHTNIYPPYQNFPNEKFSNTLSALNDIASQITGKESRVGRSYYYTIDPGKQIYPHVDTKFEYFKLIDRYQIMFDIPDGCHIEQEHSQYLPYHVHEFDLATRHAFRNEGTTQWTFIVFDVFK